MLTVSAFDVTKTDRFQQRNTIWSVRRIADLSVRTDAITGEGVAHLRRACWLNVCDAVTGRTPVRVPGQPPIVQVLGASSAPRQRKLGATSVRITCRSPPRILVPVTEARLCPEEEAARHRRTGKRLGTTSVSNREACH